MMTECLGLTVYNILKPYGHRFNGAFYFRLIVETIILCFAFSVLCLSANNFQLQYIYAKYTHQTDPFRLITHPFLFPLMLLN